MAQAHRKPGNDRTAAPGRTCGLYGYVLLALALALAGTASLGEAGPAVEGPVVPASRTEDGTRFETDGQRRLAEQKLKLLEAYLGSRRSQHLAQSGNPKIEDLLATARESLESARRALAEDRAGLAMTLIDRGLRSMAEASAAAGRPRPQQSEDLSRRRYAVLDRQIRGYLAALEPAFRESSRQACHGPALQQIRALLKRGGELAEAKAYGAATALLAEAYPITLKVVSALHQGRTAIARLEFAGPEEEFDYERKRYESYEMLLSIMLNQAESNRAALETMAKRYLAKGRHLRAEAEDQAAEGRHVPAIRTMEQATRQLGHALRAGGIAIPD